MQLTEKNVCSWRCSITLYPEWSTEREKSFFKKWIYSQYPVGKYKALDLNVIKEVPERSRGRKYIWRYNNGQIFLSFDKSYKPQIEETQWTLGKIDTKKTTPWHIVNKLPINSDNNIKSLNMNQRKMKRRKKERITSEYSSETM